MPLKPGYLEHTKMSYLCVTNPSTDKPLWVLNSYSRVFIKTKQQTKQQIKQQSYPPLPTEPT